MTVACLGWGSLIWDPRELPLSGEWLPDGPRLPLEFARESKDGRMTLVIADHKVPTPTFWIKLDVGNVEEAVRALYDREGAQWIGSIGRWPPSTHPHRYAEEIGTWSLANGLDGVVWTDLKAGFRSHRGPVPTLEAVMRHLSDLPGEARSNAARYISNAPAQIETPYRAALEHLLCEDLR